MLEETSAYKEFQNIYGTLIDKKKEIEAGKLQEVLNEIWRKSKVLKDKFGYSEDEQRDYINTEFNEKKIPYLKMIGEKIISEKKND